jgi:DNA-binding CsgD family transcriptional regulator
MVRIGIGAESCASRVRLREDLAVVLLERQAELEAIAVAIAAARRARGSSVLISGPAGIGKTAVLAAVGGVEGVRRLSARGGELERELALGVTRQLLEPALIESDSAARSRLLDGTGPAAAALEARIAAGDGDASAILHGLHRLVANLAAERPLLLAVDDVQWADAASLRFLAFLARRVAALPAVLLLARRSGEQTSDEAAVRAIASEPGIQEHVLGALSISAVRRLVGELGGADANESFCRACHAASAGNPFVLRELLTALRGRGVPLDARGAAQVAELGPPAVARWVLGRLERLPPGAARFARAVAVLGRDANLGRAARLAGLSLGDAETALDALIQTDLLAPGRRLDFVHPVVRVAVHDAMPPGKRSNTHRAAARLLRDQGSEPGAVAMHLLAAEPGAKRWVAEALLTGAHVALAQGAPEVAAAHVERALAEPAPVELRAMLLRALGNAERRLGLPTANGRFLAALEGSADPRERAEILLDMLITGWPMADVFALVQATMRELARVDPELGLILRARLLLANENADVPIEPELRAAESALAAHPEDTLGARLTAGVLAFNSALRAKSRQSVLALATRAVANDASYAADLDAGYPHIYAMMALRLADEPALAERRLTQAAERAQQRGSLVGAGIALFQRARVRLRGGLLAAAEHDARSALEHAARTSERWLIAMTVAALVEALVERGEHEAAEAVLEQHSLQATLPPGPPFADVSLARSLLRLAAGRTADAHADALATGSIAESVGVRNPILLPWRSRAALALVALGRTGEARALVHEELEIAEAADIASAIGVAKRVLALATGGEAAIPLLHDAVAILEPASAPLELSRALLDLGAALRRSGQRRAARDPLARALELAHRHAATPLAATARTELLATGARPRREVRSGVDALTPSERRVAELAAAGLSNAEIAAHLFITAKTTEHHLAAIYRKLDIRSRRQLPAMLETPHPRDETPANTRSGPPTPS